MYNTLSQLIESLTFSTHIQLKDWVYDVSKGNISFIYKGDLIASYRNSVLTLYRFAIEKNCMQRELLMKRFSVAVCSADYVYSPSTKNEVFIGYSNGHFLVTQYDEDTRIVILPNGEYLKVYEENADCIVDALEEYNVSNASDAPIPAYACMIKECPKCGAPFMIKHKVAHTRRILCWKCQP